ncbi:hypothetical protein [Bradyrhizobium sp. JYMT SZCCT0428]|uniref:hypothetical protein n=1 Tax=Bradyrhizobium sp. JYMT SZCCT0428 TaxID=2807673 RepID=UPI001BAC3DDD|nr:hypothetical protein [Bradyrhizobium sp. JYMT SZCCT0428]MBR1153740.1 hypothetical protein [Bradyrhizobium sp. JYMT SZCCT0428]
MTMHYRPEPELDYFLIKHVETDREVGYAFYNQALRADGSSIYVCRIFNNAGQQLAAPTSTTCDFPIRCAAIAIATYEEHHGFPDLTGGACRFDGNRAERRLGTVIADVALTFAHAFCEAIGQGLTTQATDKFADSIAELAPIWWVSRAGCFDAINRTEGPYFANPLPSGLRLTFSGAAQAYGMQELRRRHPDLSDAELQKVLSWVLQWLADVLNNELAAQKPDLMALKAQLAKQR